MLTLWRFALLPTCELSPAEALTVVGPLPGGAAWTHAPVVLAALGRAGVALLGWSELGVRYFTPLIAFAASVFFWRLARRIFDEQTAAWSVVVINVLPAFNLAAITLTPALVTFAGYAVLAECVRAGLHEKSRWHPAWLGAALAVVALVFADGLNVIALGGVLVALAVAPPLRGHARPCRPFWCIVAVWGAVSMLWLLWRISRGGALGGEAMIHTPELRLVPNVIRWLLLVSPLILWLLIRFVRRVRPDAASFWKKPGVSFALAFALPPAVLDFLWGTWREWPDAGLSVWAAFAIMPLVHFTMSREPAGLMKRVTIRTLAVILAAVQSFVIVRTDQVRGAGVPWAFAQRVDARRAYLRWCFADPSGAMNGWRETARLVDGIAAASKAGGRRCILLADRWQLGAPTAFYVRTSSGTAPDVRVWHPASREILDAERDRGADVIFITDDARRHAVPAELKRLLGRAQAVSIAEVMHGGHLVRTVKIFACHSWQPPDL